MLKKSAKMLASHQYFLLAVAVYIAGDIHILAIYQYLGVPGKLPKNIPKFNYMFSYLPVFFLAVIIVLIARNIPGLHFSSNHNLQNNMDFGCQRHVFVTLAAYSGNGIRACLDTAKSHLLTMILDVCCQPVCR
jgi:hypothetical protein